MMPLHPRGNFLPAWKGALEFEVDDEGHISERARREFGTDPLQGYTRKKVDISDAVAIALKGERLPDQKMLAIVDIGGGTRIGLRKTELKKPELVVKVEPPDEEVLSHWRVGTLHKSKKKGSKTVEFEPLYPCEYPEERLKIVVEPSFRVVKVVPFWVLIGPLFGIVVSKEVMYKALPTRTLYTEPPESEEDAGRWRELLKNNREKLAKEERSAKLARTKAIIRGLLEQPATPQWNRWTRPIVKERIAVSGAAAADLWLARNLSPQASEVECTECGYIGEGASSALPEIPRRPPFLVGAAFNFALPAYAPPGGTAQLN